MGSGIPLGILLASLASIAAPPRVLSRASPPGACMAVGRRACRDGRRVPGVARLCRLGRPYQALGGPHWHCANAEAVILTQLQAGRTHAAVAAVGLARPQVQGVRRRHAERDQQVGAIYRAGMPHSELCAAMRCRARLSTRCWIAFRHAGTARPARGAGHRRIGNAILAREPPRHVSCRIRCPSTVTFNGPDASNWPRLGPRRQGAGTRTMER
jgi:hypothetical protein